MRYVRSKLLAEGHRDLCAQTWGKSPYIKFAITPSLFTHSSMRTMLPFPPEALDHTSVEFPLGL